VARTAIVHVRRAGVDEDEAVCVSVRRELGPTVPLRCTAATGVHLCQVKSARAEEPGTTGRTDRDDDRWLCGHLVGDVDVHVYLSWVRAKVFNLNQRGTEAYAGEHSQHEERETWMQHDVQHGMSERLDFDC